MLPAMMGSTMASVLALLVAFATIALAKEDRSFPSIYTGHYLHATTNTIPASSTTSANWQQRLDVIRIECGESDKTITLNEKNSNNKKESHDFLSCRAQLLVHSEEEYQQITREIGSNSEQGQKEEATISNALRSLEYNSSLTQEWVHHRMKVAEDSAASERKRLLRDSNRRTEEFRNRNDFLSRIFSNDYSTIRFYDCYYDYQGTIEWIQDFWRSYAVDSSPLEVTWTDIGDSWKKTKGDGGYDIHALTITLKPKGSEGIEPPIDPTSASQRSSTAHKAPLMLVSSTHAREYTPPQLVRKWLEHLSQKVSEGDPSYLSMLEHTKIHWIPYLNPDGRMLAESTQPFRRKNVNNEWTGNTKDSSICADDNFGVDLNRNSPFEWGKADGSSKQACSSFSRGSAPGSEPESQAMVNYGSQVFPMAQRQQNALLASGGDYMVRHDPDESVLYSSTKWRGFDPMTTKGVFVDVHAYGKVYIFPWGNINAVCPNDLSFRSAMGHVETITKLDALGPGPDHYGVASGATDDWAYAVLGAFAMTWELGSRFHEPCDDFEERYERHLGAFLYLGQIAPFPFALGRGPVVADTFIEHNVLRLHYQEVEEEEESVWIFDLDDNSTDFDASESVVSTRREIVRMESNTVFDLGESIDLTIALKLPEVVKAKSASINFDSGVEGHYENADEVPTSIAKIRIFYGDSNPLTTAPTASSTFDRDNNTYTEYWEIPLIEGIEGEDDEMLYTISLTKQRLWQAFGDSEFTTDHLLYIQAMDNVGNIGPIDAIRMTILVLEELPSLDDDDNVFTRDRLPNSQQGLSLTPAPQSRMADAQTRTVDDYTTKNLFDEPVNAFQVMSSGFVLSGVAISSVLSLLAILLMGI